MMRSGTKTFRICLRACSKFPHAGTLPAPTRSLRTLIFLAASTLMMAGAAIQVANGQPLKKVSLRTDYKVNGYVGPFVLARDLGLYRQAGLDVEIGEGQGSSTTVQTVAAGRDTFGLADATTMVVGITNRSVPVRAVSVYAQTGVQGFAYHKSSNWDGKVASIKGKVIISSPGSAELSVFPAVFATAGFKIEDVELRLTDPNAKVPLFIQTPGAFLGGYATGDIVRIRLRMPDMGFAPFSQFGINTYGTSLITSNAVIEADPDLIRRFVHASAQGWEAAIKDPQAAVQAAIKQFPESDPNLLREGLKVMIDQQMHTSATAGKPIGWTAEEDWTAMLEVLKNYSGLKPKNPSDYYTNRFID